MAQPLCDASFTVVYKYKFCLCFFFLLLFDKNPYNCKGKVFSPFELNHKDLYLSFLVQNFTPFFSTTFFNFWFLYPSLILDLSIQPGHPWATFSRRVWFWNGAILPSNFYFLLLTFLALHFSLIRVLFPCNFHRIIKNNSILTVNSFYLNLQYSNLSVIWTKTMVPSAWKVLQKTLRNSNLPLIRRKYLFSSRSN